jgi:hypothetical protein
MRKLTLTLDPHVIAEARRLAAESGTSVSSMFERFIRLLARQHRSAQPLGPLARKASGIIALPKGQSEREVLEDALLEKYEHR